MLVEVALRQLGFGTDRLDGGSGHAGGRTDGQPRLQQCVATLLTALLGADSPKRSNDLCRHRFILTQERFRSYIVGTEAFLLLTVARRSRVRKAGQRFEARAGDPGTGCATPAAQRRGDDRTAEAAVGAV